VLQALQVKYYVVKEQVQYQKLLLAVHLANGKNHQRKENNKESFISFLMLWTKSLIRNLAHSVNNETVS
jgi:hypothetical protein